MATVNGYTKEHMDAIKASLIVDGHVDADGNLILEHYDGTTVNAGNVIGPPGEDASALLTIDPEDTKVTLTLGGAGTPASPWVLKAVLDALVEADIPSLDASKINSGRFSHDRTNYAFNLGTASLDTYVDPLEGYQSSSANATIANGYPADGVIGFLHVLSRSGNTQVTQVYYPGNSTLTSIVNERFYIRHRSSALIWSAWREFVSETVRKPPDIQKFTANGTWTKPTGAKEVDYVIIAGGGSGGGTVGAASGQAEGGCGGSGAYARHIVDASTLSATMAVVVGAGGNGVTGSSGNNGGSSSFNGTTCTGGTAGGLMTATAGTTAAAGGSGGGFSGTSVTFPTAGVHGSPGRVLNGLACLQGRGGGTPQGNGGVPPTSAGSGRDGTGYGSGGGGGFGTTTSQAGGDGGDGVVIITTYF